MRGGRDKYYLNMYTNDIVSLRHAIAGDVVMLSHLAMKLFYVKMDTEQMEGEDKELGRSMEELKSRMIRLKVENMALGAEREELGERAGMVANTALLGDFRTTQGEIRRTEEVNNKMNSQMEYFYDI